MTTGKGPATGQDAPDTAPDLESPAPATGRRVLQTLSPAECFDLLEPGGVGRVGFASAEGIVMLPVNFAVAGKTVIFRTAPDTLLAVHANAEVSFEVDYLDEVRREGWSVLLHGRAREITDERELRHIEDSTAPEPWAAGARDVYVRIAPTQISGRRVH